MQRLTPLLVLLAGCAPAAFDAPSDDLAEVAFGQHSILDGTPEAVGVLDLLNDPGTTLELLDDEVPLNRRTATNLMLAREIAPFESMGDVDDVYWVGSSAIAALLAYAQADGRVPSGDDYLGTWDGVEFSVNQAETALEIVVNDLEHHDFDVYLGLDRRAADSIVAAQPVATIAELAGLYYVGTSALEIIKAEAAEMMGDEWSDVSCIPEFGAWESPAADDLGELLQLSTGWDEPAADVFALQATGCEGAWWNTAAGDEILWNVTFFLDLADLPAGVAEISPWQSSGAFGDQLEDVVSIVEEHVADGDWDPSASNRGQRLYDNRDDLVDDLTSGPAASPGAFRYQSLYMDMSECSESAELMLDTRTGVLVIAHIGPAC